MLRTIFAAAAMSLLINPAQALLYNGSYTVTANGNPAVGLAVMTINDFGSPVNPTTNSFTGLNVPTNTVHFTDLFEIFALESPPYGWIEFDPTNDCFAGTDHVAVAWGRDFGDVSPLRGVILGGGKHQLSVTVVVEPVVEPAAESSAATAERNEPTSTDRT